jgi:hypothetical protein
VQEMPLFETVIREYEPIYPGITTRGKADEKFRAQIVASGMVVVGEPDVEELDARDTLPEGFGPGTPEKVYRFTYRVTPARTRRTVPP